MTVKEEKKLLVKEIQEKFKGSDLVIMAEYKGLSVAADRELRKSLRGAQAEYHVYKNSLVKRAVTDQVEGLDADKTLAGPTSFIFAKDPVSPAKVVAKFAKENEALKIKGGIYLKKFIPTEKVKELAALPSREELLSKLVYMLNSPISRFVNVLHGPLRKLVYALNAVKITKK